MSIQIITQLLNEIVEKVVETHNPIYGKEWGAYPSDSELDFEETDYGDHESCDTNIYDSYGIRPVECRDEEEYDQGDVDDYWRECEYYDC